MHPSIRRSSLSAARPTIAPLSSRAFSVSAPRPGKQDLSTNDSIKTDSYPDDKHTTRKDDGLDVQSNSVLQAKADRSADTGGHATEQRDSRNSTQKAKQEHPEAPGVVIGMQDERGGKGA